MGGLSQPTLIAAIIVARPALTTGLWLPHHHEDEDDDVLEAVIES